jgi:hypothetical protein
MIEKLMASFMSHDAAHGALPTLRAGDTSSAATTGRKKLFNHKGDPVRIQVPKPAQNAEAARKLREISEQLTGVAWPRVNAAALPRD